jgi:peptidyl-prolyl cis-trans isomerase C
MKSRFTFVAVLALALAVALALGCTGGGGGSHKSGKELAKVGTSKITVEEFEAKIEKIPPFYKKRVATPEGKKEFLDRLVMDELYYQEAVSRGLDKDSEYLDQIEAIKRNILASKVKKQILEQSVTPSDDEIRQYYEENKEEFTVPESLKLRHILVKVTRPFAAPGETEAKPTPEQAKEEAAAKAKIQKAAAKLNGKVAFEDVAKEFSDDKASAMKGGEIPPVRKGVKSKEFEDAAWALTAPGQVSPIFQDRRGFNLVKLEEMLPASVKEFDKVKEQIKRKLENEKRKNALDEFNKKLKEKASVVVHEDLLAGIGPSVEETESAPGMPGMPQGMMGGEGGPARPAPMLAPGAPAQAPAATPAPDKPEGGH